MRTTNPIPTVSRMILIFMPVLLLATFISGAHASTTTPTPTLDDDVIRSLVIIEGENKILKQDIFLLIQQVSVLSSENALLKEKTIEIPKISVAFTATGISSYNPSPRGTLKPQVVVLNEGGGFDNTTGHFTAPVAGTYTFAASFTGFASSGHYIAVYLMVEGQTKASAVTTNNGDSNFYQSMSLNLACNLQAGQEVWLVNYSEAGLYFDKGSHTNTFTGFMVGPYP